MLFVFFLFIWASSAFEKIAEIPIQNPPVAISADVYQRVYVAEGKGVIRQYDSTGKELAYYSPTQLVEVTALEARFGVRVYAFYQDLQRFTVFNRFLQPLEQFALPAEKVGFAQNVAWGADRLMWIWDSQNMHLKRYNPLTEDIIMEVSLLQIFGKELGQIEPVRMQEFENRLYIFDKGRAFVLDYLGNLVATLPTQAQSVTCLHTEQCWSLAGKEMDILPLYQTMEKKSLPFPDAPQNPLFLYIHQQTFWIIDPQKITIWRLKPD